MPTRILQKVRSSLKKRKVKVFLLFLLCATMAWFVSKLSQSYSSITTFDLKYLNASEDLMLVSASKEKIEVKLEAVGFQFLRFNFKKKKVAIDLSTVVKKRKQYYLLYDDYKAQIDKQLPSSMRLIDVERDTLFFDFQKVVTKEVVIKPDLQLNLAQNYLLDGKLEITPKTIEIKGPKNEVDTIEFLTSAKIDLTDLTSDFSHDAKIVIPKGLVYTVFSTKTVNVVGKVTRFSEKMIPVSIKVLNLPNGTSIKMFPDNVNVLCRGNLNALKKLEGSDFEVVADFQKVRNKKLLLKISKKPEKLSSAVLQENQVAYILKRD